MPQTDSLAPADQACMVYVTVATRDEGLAIARALVAERLAACVNVLGPATSVYTWEGKTEESQEFVMVCKTRRALGPALSARVKALHSYDTPCIVSYAMQGAYPPFLDWIAASTASA
jgi:periplasmic divalent cation tolerance protein